MDTPEEITQELGNIEMIDFEEFMKLFEELDDEEDVSAYDDDEDEDEESYESATLSEEVRRAQREFRSYMKELKEGLENLGYLPERNDDNKDAGVYGKKENQETTEQENDTNPFERGHRWGCGCSACTNFREGFYSSDMSPEDLSLPDTISLEEASRQIKDFVTDHRENANDYPCGGKLRGYFRGKRIGDIETPAPLRRGMHYASLQM